MGQFPFDAQNEGALIRKILKGSYTPVTGPYTATLVREEIRQHSYIFEVDYANLLKPSQYTVIPSLYTLVISLLTTGPAGTLITHL